MAMARPLLQLCTLLSCLFFIVPVAARPPVVPIAARPPPACSGTGVQPVALTKPLEFCGGKIGDPTCCDAANDSTIHLAFVHSFSRPSKTHDADAASCAALVKRRLCAVSSTLYSYLHPLQPRRTFCRMPPPVLPSYRRQWCWCSIQGQGKRRVKSEYRARPCPPPPPTIVHGRRRRAASPHRRRPPPVADESESATSHVPDTVSPAYQTESVFLL
ncbi:unnamed protein product [Miscanthus lutarioriparius]|uniref:Uncharacterized protein n=1 Tax=Miscanthus lutarioriparius TaxID=422564 RepID=A0A811MLT2_9POAL|nr:unnamed protein product [Miscanthus lutarioriparius]